MITLLFYMITSGVYVWTIGSTLMKIIWTIVFVVDIISLMVSVEHMKEHRNIKDKLELE